MAKLTEAASLQIVFDNLLARLCLNESIKTSFFSSFFLSHVTFTRSNKLALYFEQSSLDKSRFKKSLYQKSNSLQNPSLQRIFRWMSVKGDRI
jgi:hypothetical protein